MISLCDILRNNSAQITSTEETAKEYVKELGETQNSVVYLVNIHGHFCSSVRQVCGHTVSSALHLHVNVPHNDFLLHLSEHIHRS